MKVLIFILMLTSLSSPFVLAAEKVGLPTCVVCHGAGLQGNIAVGAPNLSILPDWYIMSQLKAYQQSWRGVEESLPDARDMHAVALALSDKELEQALEFIRSKSPRSAKPKISGNISRGKQLFATCSACHGDMAQGDKVLSAPPLAGQNDWYIVAQLKAYQANYRGYVQDDSKGNMMRSSISLLSNEQDILDVASYVNSIKISKE